MDLIIEVGRSIAGAYQQIAPSFGGIAATVIAVVWLTPAGRDIMNAMGDGG